MTILCNAKCDWLIFKKLMHFWIWHMTETYHSDNVVTSQIFNSKSTVDTFPDFTRNNVIFACLWWSVQAEPFQLCMVILYKFLLVLCGLWSIFWVRGDSEVMVELCVFPGLVWEVSSDWFSGLLYSSFKVRWLHINTPPTPSPPPFFKFIFLAESETANGHRSRGARRQRGQGIQTLPLLQNGQTAQVQTPW